MSAFYDFMNRLDIWTDAYGDWLILGILLAVVIIFVLGRVYEKHS